MRLSRDHLWSANAGALGTSVGACRLEATEARGKPLPMLRPGLKSYFEGGGDFAEDSKEKCVHTLVFVFLDFTAIEVTTAIAASSVLASSRLVQNSSFIPNDSTRPGPAALTAP